jgi:anaerobic ribonucleoside-triphosphate reductase activating protein
MADTPLVLSRIADRVGVLGPGLRAVVWVRGCPLRCAGCVTPEDLPFEGGESVSVTAVAARLNTLGPEVTGVTFSGGEPMAQAAGLAELLDRLRADRDWSAMSYTGYTMEHLRRHGTAAQHALLDRLDILVDGPYLARRHADLLWRGSANQRLLLLTDRHRPPRRDRSAGLEFEVDGDLVGWTGVPPTPGFREALESSLAGQGIVLRAGGTADLADLVDLGPYPVDRVF